MENFILDIKVNVAYDNINKLNLSEYEYGERSLTKVIVE